MIAQPAEKMWKIVLYYLLGSGSVNSLEDYESILVSVRDSRAERCDLKADLNAIVEYVNYPYGDYPSGRRRTSRCSRMLFLTPLFWTDVPTVSNISTVGWLSFKSLANGHCTGQGGQYRHWSSIQLVEASWRRKFTTYYEIMSRFNGWYWTYSCTAIVELAGVSWKLMKSLIKGLRN